MNHKVGNLVTEVTSGIIVQSCNTQGVMNSGIAKEIRNKYPKVFEEYKSALKTIKENKLGLMIPIQISKDFYICNIIGQEFYGKDKRKYVSYDAIEEGFECIKSFAIQKKLDVNYPLIGSGLGGGNWNIISVIINETLIGIEHTLWTLK